MENYKIAIFAGLFLIGSIIAFLVVPMSQERTLILTEKDGGAPISCLDTDQLILAQNLTDLCDVVIISPQTNQTLVYNGTQWVNVNSTSFDESTTCNNIGTGIIICAGGNVNLKSLIAGNGITISNDTNTITVDSFIQCNVASGGTVLTDYCTQNQIALRNLVGLTGISVGLINGTHIGITNTTPESTNCTSAGGTTIIKTSSGGDCDFKGLTAGVGLTLTSNTNDNNYKTNFINGTGISITGTTSQTFTNTGVISDSCSNGISCSGTNPSVFTVSWEKLCTTTGTGTSISCGSFTARKHLTVQIEYRTVTNTMVQGIRFNSDSGTNYSTRSSSNGGADSTGTSLNQCTLRGGGSFSTNDRGIHSYWIYNNQSGDRKLMTGEIVAGADTSAGTAPTRIEQTCKWDNTSDQITSIQLIVVSGTGTFDTGTQITVWGYD